jgi:hypothetical protein
VVEEATTTEPTDQKIVTSPLLDTLKIKESYSENSQIATLRQPKSRICAGAKT